MQFVKITHIYLNIFWQRLFQSGSSIQSDISVLTLQQCINMAGSLVGEWLGHSLAVLGVDGSNPLTAWFELPYA